MSTDYKDTVFLPKSPFPMRANLPKREPVLLARWAAERVWDRQREASLGREKFVLHDGPPYANGNLHIGHALNKILKDIISRSQQQMGKDSVYVPGWDCHGLPIEWKVEERYRAQGKDKDDVPVLQFRQECREFAAHWVDVQRDEFKRLGVEGDWDNPYLTMSFDAEAQIAREIGKFVMNGGLYRGAKPVMWSVVEKTALADAEVEYDDHVSDTIWVRFKIIKPSDPALEGANVVIWTTTPWTIPGNRAVAYGAEHDYAVVRITDVLSGSRARVGETLVLARDLLERVMADAKVDGFSEIATLPGTALAGTVCHHPFQGQGYDFPVPLLAGSFVDTEQGTGFVHIAPGHGQDDWELGQAHGIEVPFTVGEDGVYFDHVPLFAGKTVYYQDGKMGDANAAVRDALNEAGQLLAHGRLKHSYPHSWRSKAPLIFRNTAQWFISMEANDLRAKALRAIEETRWVPKAGETRIRSMIEQRPDWCISRQRAWGVPIPVFVNKRTGEMLRDQAVIDRVAAAFEEEGGDAWFAEGAKERFLGNDHAPDEWEQVRDIVEVWFESGSTHAFVLEQRDDLKWPASLYLEGTDQHRGWFHSSLLESCGTRGQAPYEAVLTHGFTMDEQGRKMSKSLGNVTAPQEVVDAYGADILRLWVITADYAEDQRIGPEILKQVADAYRRFRNTLRFLIGALDGFDETERVPVEEMPELERWVLHRLAELDGAVRRAYDDFDLHLIYRLLHDFCAVDLSAFYFDIRKDRLYCDRPDDPGRRACRTVLDHLFRALTAWLAPVLCFTAEEAHLARDGQVGEDGDFLTGKPGESVHLVGFPDIPASWLDPALGDRWAVIRGFRRVVTGMLELERAEKKIGSSLQAHPVAHVPAALVEALGGVDLAEICITSGLSLTTDPAPDGAFRLDGQDDGVAVARIDGRAGLAKGAKCERCWRVLPDVAFPPVEGLCGRCVDAVEHARTAAA